jgi:uncharacterized membrane protein
MPGFMYTLTRNILLVNQINNPATDDPNAGIFGIVLVALIVSAVLIVMLVAAGKRK